MGICGGRLARGAACITAALAFVVASGTARPSEAEAANGLFPILDCVTYHEVTDTVTARFGFSNTIGVAQQAPITENYFDPPPEYRDQPEIFQPGTYHEVFEATFPAGFNGNGYLTWNLRGSSVTARNDPNIYCEGADTTAPDTAILDGPRGTVRETTAVFDLFSEGGATFQYSLDSGGFGPAGDPLVISGLGDGVHTIQVRAMDAAGNIDPTPASRSWVVDATAPSPPMLSSPANGSTDRDGSFNVRGSAEPGSTVRLFEGAARVGSAEADPGTGAWSISLVDVPDGTHILRARATDMAENTSAESPPLTVTVDTSPQVEQPPAADTTAPPAPVMTAPGNGSTDRDGSFNVRGTAEPGSTVRLYEDGTRVGTSETDPGSGAWTIAVVDADDGSHSYRTRATDAAYNTSPDSAPISMTVDGTAPEVEAVRPTPGSTAGREALVTARFSEPVDWAFAASRRAFTLTKRGATKPVRATVGYDAGTRTAILDPERRLRRGDIYDVVLSTSIRDLAGNRLEETTGWSFRVKKVAKR